MESLTVNQAWLSMLDDLVHQLPLAPSIQQSTLGQTYRPTREILAYNSVIDMNFPIVSFLDRKLSYRFMFAEALWILSGSNLLEDIAPYGPQWRNYSDDGVTLAGAYGPMVKSQIPYIIKTLLNDRNSRQAVMTIWNPTPKPSKDIPCTVYSQFIIRGDKLHLIHEMRSSDAWVGWPYDIFCFTMVAEYIRLCLPWKLKLGNIYFRAGSQHLYEDNYQQAINLIAGEKMINEFQRDSYFQSDFQKLATPEELIKFLITMRDL